MMSPFSATDFATAFELAPAPLLLINMENGAIREANQAALQFMGYTRAQVIGKTTLDLGTWMDPLLHSQLMQSFLETGSIAKQRVAMRHRLGYPLSVELSLTRMLQSGERCVLATFTDLCERQKLESDLQTAREQLRVTLRHHASATWDYDLRHGTIALSATALAILGYGSDKALTPLAPDAFVCAEDGPLLQEALQGLCASAPTLRLELRMHSAQGKVRWFRLVGHWMQTFSNEGEAAPCVQGILEDIHEDKLHDMERLRNEQRAALAIAVTDMGTWEMLEDGTAIWDAQTYRLYGYDPATPKKTADIFRDALSDAEFERCSRWLGKSVKYSLSLSIEFELTWPDGQRRWLATKGHGITDPSTGAKTLLGVGWDITDRRRAQDALRKHRADLSRLNGKLLDQEKDATRKLAQVLHDQLGQTLTAARLMLDFQMQSHPSEAGRRMEMLMTQAMEQVRGLLMDLRPPLLDERGLGPALDNEIQRVRSLGVNTDILFQCNDYGMHSRWPSDVEYAFFMIAREAITNALTHARAQLVQVQLSAEANGLALEISDDGQGLASGHLQGTPGHLGVVGMHERAAGIQARLSVSSMTGEGVRIQLMWTPAP